MQSSLYEKIPILFRDGSKEDEAFVYSAWLHSFKKFSHGWNLPDWTYFQEHHKVVEKILHRSRIILALNKEDIDQIFGFIVSELNPPQFLVHYLYVKQPYRQLGIGSALIAEAMPQEIEIEPKEIFYTHSTMAGEALARKWKAHFNPYGGF